MNFTLEKYRSMRSRHTCPACGNSRVFARYVSVETGEYLDSDVGRCNRENKCGYHYTPAEYFRNNPDSPHRPPKPTKPAPLVARASGDIRAAAKSPIQKTETSFHSKKTLDESQGQNGRNPFYQFLLDLFPDEFEQVKKAAEDYYLGYFQNLTCFWQIDVRGRIRKGKLMRYDPCTGKRQPVFKFKDEKGEEVEIGSYWVHKALQKRKEISADAVFENCFFGEHLLADGARARQTVCIVEAEKTAIICAIKRPNFIWLAVGAKAHLTLEKMQVLKNRNVILYPDGDAYSIWKEKELEFGLKIPGLNIKTSDLLERTATEAEKLNGFDLADYIIREQRVVNEFNARIDRIAREADLFEAWNFALDERAAIAGVNPTEMTPENLRILIDYVL